MSASDRTLLRPIPTFVLLLAACGTADDGAATTKAAAPPLATTSAAAQADDAPGGARTGGWRLADSDSPYLRSHADNPVDWYPWGEAAFARAQELDRPIFISIGYSSCHWCHVMEHESFEDAEIAAYLNEHFVSIKVDREQRPDVDARYMAAVQAMSGSGGWPLTAMCTPEGAPFWGGTYFPPRDSRRGPGFLGILEWITNSWSTDRTRILEVVAANEPRLLKSPLPKAGPWDADEVIARAVTDLQGALDPVYGGVRSERPQRFPPSMLLQFLVRQQRRGADVDLELLQVTLDGMAGGGMRDHVAGGFHRYSVDPRWKVPHFEKMLYDNALIPVAYAETYAVTGLIRNKRIARDTFDWLMADMRAPDGLYYAARDADSLPFDASGQPLPDVHPEEGDVYTWTPSELVAVLGAEDATHFARLFDVTEDGNFERGRSIPRPETTLDALAADPGEGLPTGDAFFDWLQSCYDRLLVVRDARPQAFRDEKCLAGWNGLALTAFARCGRLLDDAELRDEASGLADAIVAHLLTPDGGLHHQVFEGRPSGTGDLFDYAAVTRGLLDASEATGRADLLAESVRLAHQMLARFEDPEGGLYSTEGDDPLLPGRTHRLQDGATPTGNSVAVETLLRLAPLDDSGAFHGAAERTLDRMGKVLPGNGRAFVALLAGVDAYRGPLAEVVVDDPDGALVAEARGAYLPASLLISDPAGAAEALADVFDEEPSLLAGRRATDGEPLAWVCKQGVCLRPATSPEELAEQWSSVLAP